MTTAPIAQTPGRRTPPWSWYTDTAILQRLAI